MFDLTLSSKSVILGTLFGLLSLTISFGVNAQGGPPPGTPGAEQLPDFDPFSGSYFTQSQSGDPNTDTVMSIHSDGTLALSLANMFCTGIAGVPDCDRLSPELGTWIETGADELSVVEIQFRTTDDAGGVFTTGGIILKLTWVQTFGDTVNGVYQSFVADNIIAEVFLFGQNPITDDPVAVVPVPIPFAGQRINVE